MERYKFIHALGEGGYGQADLMLDRVTGKYVVVKTVKCQKESELRGAKKEAEILKKLHHPNIIQYLNSFVGSTKKDFRIVLEYADAKDLKHYIERNSPVKEAKILEIFAQIMLGIQYIHSPSIHILHRDIKAANVFLFKNGLVKIGDFGVSREISVADPALTFVGTPYFMSPELLRGLPYGFPSDIWAAGLLLYELMTGEHAFTAGSREELYEKIKRGQKPETPKGYSSELTSLLESMMNMNPQKRPTADDVIGLPIMQRALRQIEKMMGKKKETRAKTPARSASKESAKAADDEVDQSEIPEWILNNQEVGMALVRQSVQQIEADSKWLADVVRSSVARGHGLVPVIVSVGKVQSDLADRKAKLESEVRARLGDEKYQIAHDFVKEHFMEDREQLPHLLDMETLPEAELKIIDVITMIERYDQAHE